MTQPPPDVVADATDPSTTAARLAEIADQHHSLHSAVLAHPALYDGLREWIEAQARGDAPTEATSLRPEAPAQPEAASPSASPMTSATAPSGLGWSWPAAILVPVGVVILVAAGCSIAFAATVSAEASASSFGDDFSSSSGGTSDSDEFIDDVSVNEAPEATPVESRLPASCDSLYSPSMRAQLEGAGLTLNPPRVDAVDHVGTSDAILASYIERPLECVWTSASSDTGTWIITTISEISPGDQAAIEQRLADYTALDSLEVGGHRYVTDAVTWGESHLIRDGLWFATRWNTFGPNGYTADMVVNHFG